MFFMHLWWDSPFNAMALITALFFVALFIGLALFDCAFVSVRRSSPRPWRPRAAVVNKAAADKKIGCAPIICASPVRSMTLMSGTKIEFRAPRRASTIGLWLFLAALAMLFISSMWLYVLMRLGVFGRISNAPVHVPSLAWGSTVVLWIGSFTIHRAVAAIRRERLKNCLKFLYLTCALAVVFLAVQSPCMAQVLQRHLRSPSKPPPEKAPANSPRFRCTDWYFSSSWFTPCTWSAGSSL